MSVPQWHTHETGLCNGWLYRPDATVSRSLGPPKARHRSRSSCQIYGLQLKKKKKLRPWSVETSVVTTCSSFKKKLQAAYMRRTNGLRFASGDRHVAPPGFWPFALTRSSSTPHTDAIMRASCRSRGQRRRVGHKGPAVQPTRVHGVGMLATRALGNTTRLRFRSEQMQRYWLRLFCS